MPTNLGAAVISRFAVGALAIAATVLMALAPPALAGKAPAGVIGDDQSGTLGGLFSRPADVAVNQATGQIYVADMSNDRIQRFDSAGSFERAWGKGVVIGGGSGDVPGASEVQTVTAVGEGGTFVLGASNFDRGVSAPGHTLLTVVGEGGTFTLEVGGQPAGQRQTTAPIARDASAAAVREAIAALGNVGAGDVSVSGPDGGPWDVAIDLDGIAVRGADASGLTGAPKSVSLKSGEYSEPIPRGASAAEVQAALEALEVIGAGDVSVSGSAGGPWQVEFTGEHADADIGTLLADASGLLGEPHSLSVATTTEAQTSFEICTVAAQCRGGTTGFLGGELDSPEHLAINQDTGHLYVSDQTERITEFDADGNFVRLWGAGVVKSGGTGDVPANETQRIGLHPDPRLWPDGGTFALSFKSEQTAQLPLSATAAQIQAALEDLAAVAPGDVLVSGPEGGPWTVEFAGAYADTDVSLDVENDNLTQTQGGQTFPGGVLVVETKRAAGGFEICSVASECKPASQRGDAAGQQHGINGAAAPLAAGPNGEVFIGDTGNSRILHHEADGGFVRAWGWGVDTQADAFEICTAASGCKRAPPYDSEEGATNTENGEFFNEIPGSGIPVGEFPTQLTVDDSGTVYASNADSSGFGPQGPRLDRFDPTAANAADLLLADPIRSQDPPNGAPAGPLVAFPRGLEIDPGSGHLYYSASGQGIRELDLTDPPTEVDVHLPNPGAPVSGIGYDEAGDRLFATVLNDHRIVIAADGAPTPPPATIDEPEVTGETSATFSGEVTPGGPEGIDTYYRFEYRKAGAESWTKLPASDVNLGDGEAAVAVEQSLSNLEVAVDYEVRLVATKEFGSGQTITAPQHFILAEVAPSVITVFPQARTDTTATLAGTIDTRNREASYYFEWGADPSYGNRLPVPDGTLAPLDGPQTVTAQIGGLDPEATYHYRVVADSGVEEAPGDTLIEGEDVAFTTRATPPDTEPARAWEMVTPPFKSVRSVVKPSGDLGNNPNPGVPSLDGDTMAWQAPFFPMTDEVRAGLDGDGRIIRRTAAGWANSTLNTLPYRTDIGWPFFVRQNGLGTSGDFETVAWSTSGGAPVSGGLLPTEGSTPNRTYTRRDGTGVKGFTPWVDNVDTQVFGAGFSSDNNPPIDQAILNDDGSAMARWGSYRGLAEDPDTPGDDDPSDESQLAGNDGARTAYLQRADDPDAMPGAEKDLVGECTGSPGGGARAAEVPTSLPARIGSGEAADVIGLRQCAEGSLTSPRGTAIGGASDSGPNHGSVATALSDDGRRLVFTSPDPGRGVPSRTFGSAPSACAGGTGDNTDCPPQLFVRQYDDDGEPIVRWISRSRSSAAGDGAFSGAMIADQRIAEMGVGAGFQGASRDGRYVYFKTNAPLVPDDPDGGTSVTGDAASNASWDIYRYELPADLDADPDEGRLLRVSGGPDGNADPSTNLPSGDGGALRFHSDDGRRAYFLTSSPIAGADQAPPAGGATAPGGTVGNTQTRNLYLFDDAASGSDRYRFVARIPLMSDGGEGASGGALAEELNACASFGSALGHHASSKGGENIGVKRGNCFRGTPDGRQTIFFTTGQLTGDDTDLAGDVYLYDAEADELTRVSAPPAGVAPYVCNRGDQEENGDCNATLGWAPYSFGEHWSARGDFSRGWGGFRYNNISANPDGTTSVYFESKASLLPEDTNETKWDVYEWREGELSLISPGSEDDSWFSGNSVDGEDVFIWTSARIDPREIDDADFDLYDARRGGGFPYTPPPQPCAVLALGCEGDAISPPALRAPRTLATGPSGNVSPAVGKRRCAKAKLRRGKRCVPKAAIARKRCRKARGKAKRRCVRKQVRKLTRAQRRANRKARRSR